MTTNTCTCGRPTAGAWLCERCTRTLAWAILNTSAYSLDATLVVATRRARYGNAGSIRGSAGKEQPLPVDQRFLATRPTLITEGRKAGELDHRYSSGSEAVRQAETTVQRWVKVVRQSNPMPAGAVCPMPCLHTSCARIRACRPPRPDVSSGCHFLARWQRWSLGQGWVLDMFEDFLAAEMTLARVVNRPADRWYAGKCSATDESGNYCTTEIYAAVDRGVVTCPGCETRHDVAERRDFLLAEAKDYLVTATEAAGALLAWTDYDGTETKLIDRIRKWRDREKLEVRDVTSLQGRDRHLYRLGDVQDLLVEHAQREQQRRIGA